MCHWNNTCRLTNEREDFFPLTSDRVTMLAQRILLAGANNYRWRSYQERLRADGLESRLVTSGVDCVAALRDFRPEILVLDPNIPWGGGDGVLAVRDEEPEFNNNLVVILTAGCEPSLLYRMSDYAIDDLVWQPISAAALQQRLERLLELRQESVTEWAVTDLSEGC